MNPIQQLKNQQSSNPNQLLLQGESPDKLLQEQNLELEKIEELTEKNQSFELMSFGIKLDSKYPRKIAILEVESPGNNDIVIRCHNQFFKLHEQLNTDPIQASEISFDQMMDARIIQETIGIMRMFSQKNSQAKKLRGWLIKLQERLEQNYQHNLSYLIINDRTSFEIPWEMLELKKNNYLGANIVTVRWQDITNPEDLDDVNGLINLEVAEKKCYGKMVAYLNTKDLPSVKEEKKFLEKFNPTIYDNVRDFFNYLDAVNSDVSLVFIASH
ncbi:MAG: CHAT domain-containing protein, partial [Okeania sp. SIO2D1]|nr:CHAT domain-containing protein [Okeania sp. SIO2D1]